MCTHCAREWEGVIPRHNERFRKREKERKRERRTKEREGERVRARAREREREQVAKQDAACMLVDVKRVSEQAAPQMIRTHANAHMCIVADSNNLYRTAKHSVWQTSQALTVAPRGGSSDRHVCHPEIVALGKCARVLDETIGFGVRRVGVEGRDESAWVPSPILVDSDGLRICDDGDDTYAWGTPRSSAIGMSIPCIPSQSAHSLKKPNHQCSVAFHAKYKPRYPAYSDTQREAAAVM